jgi:hypothetical protein
MVAKIVVELIDPACYRRLVSHPCLPHTQDCNAGQGRRLIPRALARGCEELQRGKVRHAQVRTGPALAAARPARSDTARI